MIKARAQVLGALGCFGAPPGAEGAGKEGAGGEPTGGAAPKGAVRRPPAADPAARSASNAPPVGRRRLHIELSA